MAFYIFIIHKVQIYISIHKDSVTKRTVPGNHSVKGFVCVFLVTDVWTIKDKTTYR